MNAVKFVNLIAKDIRLLTIATVTSKLWVLLHSTWEGNSCGIISLLTIRKYPSANTGINLYYHAIFGLSFSAFVSFTITACRGTSTVSIHWNFRVKYKHQYIDG
jgi:hypothetical protein